mmetsp:Transcript_96476/g.166262  ORF Transcript_96476/g.166262 Transcript_96476/m.166262 type:complete len:163 (+) Transcript_96476:1139-1627(+)
MTTVPNQLIQIDLPRTHYQEVPLCRRMALVMDRETKKGRVMEMLMELETAMEMKMVMVTVREMLMVRLMGKETNGVMVMVMLLTRGTGTEHTHGRCTPLFRWSEGTKTRCLMGNVESDGCVQSPHHHKVRSTQSSRSITQPRNPLAMFCPHHLESEVGSFVT